MADDLAVVIARRAPTPGAVLVPGQVVMVGGVPTVNVAGGVGTVRWHAALTPVDGDSVLVALQGSEAWVVCRTTATARPDTGTVQSIPGGDTITVDVAGTSTTCRFLAAYAPVVGDLVYLSWQSSQPVVLGKVGTTTAPTPPPPPPAPPTVAATGTSTFAAVESRSWRSGQWRTDTTDVAQGDAPGYGGHPNNGAWFYGTAPQSLAGATVTSAEIWLPGESSSVSTPTVHLYRHTSGTRPAGDVTRVSGPYDVSKGGGTSGWYPFDTAAAQAIVDAGGGVAITGSPYARHKGLGKDGQSGALRIHWSR